MAEQTHHVRAIITGVRIIEALEQGGRLGVTEIEQRTGVAKSSVYKYLDTLRDQGFVTKDDDGQYSLSLRWFEIGNRVRNRQSVVQLTVDRLDRLAERTGETVSLVVEENGDAVYLYQTSEEESEAPILEGERIPAPISVGGKAIYAYRPDDEVSTLLDENDITDGRDALLEEFDAIHAQRMVIERGSPLQGSFSAGAFEGHRHVVGHDEPYHELHSVAVPVRDPDEYAVAAIEVSGAESSLYERRLEEEIANLVVTTAREIETALIQQSDEQQ